MKRKISVLYATETGNAEGIAETAVSDLKDRGFEAEEFNLGDYAFETLKEEQDVLVIASTWGDGDPPEEAIDFYESFTQAEPLGLCEVRFAVFALGDSAYEHFCKHGKELDEHFARHGAARLFERVDCDLDEDEQYPFWMEKVIALLEREPAASAT